MVTKYYDLKENLHNEYIEDIVLAYKNGEVIAFPTETVYGLGADINNEEAIKKIFIAKNRPMDNPLIAHVGRVEDVDKIAFSVPLKGKKLMEKFWPGPLTLVLKKRNEVSSLATAGLNTIGIRMPDSPITESILIKGNLILVAPSANISGSPSPTSFNHVKNDLDGLIYGIIDGGYCEEGIESTIIDMTSDIPVILRPGTITKEEIEEVIGKVFFDEGLFGVEIKEAKAPGMKYRHYSPKAKVYIIEEKEKISNLLLRGKNALVIFDENIDYYKGLKDIKIISLGSRKNLKMGIKNLYKILRDCDDIGIENIFIEKADEIGLGFSYMNRLKKAANYNFLRRS